MRTTLTLDDDVAILLRRLHKKRGIKLKDLVNQALREGLTRLEGAPTPKTRFEVVPLEAGPCLMASLDDVTEVLNIAEGEDYR